MYVSQSSISFALNAGSKTVSPPIPISPSCFRNTAQKIYANRVNGSPPVAWEPLKKPATRVDTSPPITWSSLKRTTASAAVAARPSVIKKLSAEEGLRVLQSAEVYSGNPEALGKIARAGLAPRESITVANARYSISDVFEIYNGGDRNAVVVVVETAGKKTVQVFYESGSQGTFRNLPGIGELYREGKFVSATWLDKADNESALELPSEVDQLLAQKVLNREVHPVANGDDVVMSIMPKKYIHDAFDPTRVERSKVMANHPVFKVTKTDLLDSSASKPLKARNKYLFPKPEDVRLARPGMAVDFAKPPAREYQVMAASGRVKAKVYYSKDSSLEYVMYEDKDGKAWVAKVSNRNASINAAGVRSVSIDAGALSMPRWEYSVQIPEGYQGRSGVSTYYDAWSYLREIPFIQSYYQARGLPVPK